MVNESFPIVSVPDIGEAHEYSVNIDHNGFFETTYLSEDDMSRNAMYIGNAKRKDFRSSFADYGDYLKSLDMRATIRSFEPLYSARIAQLTNKSNQFNLTTKRFSKMQIEKMMSDEGYVTLYGKLTDQFGDNGIVSVCAGKIEDDVCHVILWLMSCRVLRRGMENAMFDVFVRECADRGIRVLRGYYYPTEKNSMVKDFYNTMGFVKVSETEEESIWSFSIDGNYINRNQFIKVEK